MATTTKSTAKKPASASTKKPAPRPVEEATEVKVAKKAKPTIPDSAMINVKSNVFGTLVFHSKKTGEEIVWYNSNEVQQVSMALLRNIKTECIAFYRDQYILFVGFADEYADEFTVEDIYDQLYVKQYYKNVIDPSDYESLCSLKPAEIKEKVGMMTEGAKANLIVALNSYIEEGVLDSVRAIKAFEEVLGCELRQPE